MNGYQTLQRRLDSGEVIILDGAIGTELQRLGAPLHPIAWAASALETHPYTVRHVHERYIRAGADIITTNTFSNLRHVLEAAGYESEVRELTLRAVYLAREARDGAAGDRPVAIAGSMSAFGVGRDPRTGTLLGGSRFGHRISADDARSHYQELAETLAEAGVDFFLIEHLENQEHRVYTTEAARATGLPVWVGFTLAPDLDGSQGVLRETVQAGLSLEQAMKEIIPLGVQALTILHSRIDHITAALPIMRRFWSGPIAVYPDARRNDFFAAQQDRTERNAESVDVFVQAAQRWVDLGAQIVGGCCGFGVEYIAPLRERLASRTT